MAGDGPFLAVGILYDAIEGVLPFLALFLALRRMDRGLRVGTPDRSSERLTGVLLDRLTHHVHILEMNGDSYRLKLSRESAVSPPSDEPHEE